jgi:ubiquinone/menaquinone biosynthesis C-methylase UbiE
MSKENLAKEYDQDFKNKKHDKIFEMYVNHPMHPRFTRVATLVKKGDYVLDVGCGNGYGLYCLQKTGANLFGIDVSQAAIDTAKDNLAKHRISAKLSQKELTDTGFADNYFNVVYASQVMEHVEDPEAMIKEMLRVTKEDGFILVTVPIGKQLYNDKHLHFFGFYELMDIFDKFGYDYKIFKHHKFREDMIDRPNIWMVIVNKGAELGENDNPEVDENE